MVEPWQQTIIRVDDPTLPRPWQCLIHLPRGLLYFWNPKTRVRQYERPSAGPPYLYQFYREQNSYPKPPSTSIPINCPRHGEEGEDMISELPDELILRILCFLPTISAVLTTFLSKRWNKMWTFVRHLDFDTDREMFDYRSHFDSFVQFVFLRLSSSVDIEEFRLRYTTSPDDSNSGDVSAQLNDWVSAAVWRNVVELDLKIVEATDEFSGLPRSIFWCKTLKVLKLWIDQGIEIPEPPTTGCFPSLKIFHLTVTDPYESLGNILSYLPVLEDLSIHVQLTSDYKTYINVKVSTPELKTLKLSMERKKKHYYRTLEQDSFCVDAPKLEELEVIQIPLSNYILENPKSVFHASIAFKSLAEEDWSFFPDHAYQLLSGISNVKCLSLSDQPFEVSHLPVFGNLNQLRLVLRYRNTWEFLTALLHKTPNLEDLDIVSEDGTEGEKDDPELQWTPPELVPDCLSSNLKTISIRGFKGLQVESQVAEYMLLNGCHLNKMTIYTCISEEEESCKDLLTFKRAMTCQLEFREMQF